MALLSLLHSRKQNTLYNDFLAAYARIRELKDVPKSLGILLECLLDERQSEKHNRCMEYYVMHDVDSVILQLAATDPERVEDFFLSLFPFCERSYLAGPFPKLIWRYGTFTRLTLLYAELCVKFGIFNKELASHLTVSYDDAHSNSMLGILVCASGMREYREYFEEVELGQMAVAKASAEFLNRSPGAVRLINFVSDYEDATARGIGSVGGENKPGGKRLEGVDVEGALEKMEDGQDIIPYLGAVYRGVKCRFFRMRLLRATVRLMDIPRYSEFLLKCILAEPLAVAAVMGEKRVTVSWDVREIHDLLSETPQSDRPLKEVVEGLFGPLQGSKGIYERILQVAREDPARYNRFPFTERLLHAGCRDIRIYAFLLLTSPRTFYANMKRILEAADDRPALTEVVRLALEEL